MDALTRYVFYYFGRFQTPQEAAAYKSFIAEEKARSFDSAKIQKILRQDWVSTDTEVLKILEDGSEQFLINVRDRILREHSESVFLNLCPKCGSLARTPQAKQCQQCFFSWHEQQ